MQFHEQLQIDPFERFNGLDSQLSSLLGLLN